MTKVKKSAKNKPKMTKSDAGRLGALALNANPAIKSKAAKAAVATRKALDPACFSKMGAKRGSRSKSA